MGWLIMIMVVPFLAYRALVFLRVTGRSDAWQLAAENILPWQRMATEHAMTSVQTDYLLNHVDIPSALRQLLMIHRGGPVPLTAAQKDTLLDLLITRLKQPGVASHERGPELRMLESLVDVLTLPAAEG